MHLPIVAPAAVNTPTLAPCSANQLSIGLDSEDGTLAGMSHNGTLLVVRNLGPNACETPQIPVVDFRDAAGRPLPIVRTPTVGMHPGPFLRPVAVAPHAELTSTLSWVAGDVYAHGHCYSPATLGVGIGTTTLRVPIAGNICGPLETVHFNQTRLTPDPPSPQEPYAESDAGAIVLTAKFRSESARRAVYAYRSDC